MVRGGHHDIPARCRPFTIVHLDPGGPAMLEVKILTQLEKGQPTNVKVFYWFVQGTVRPGDRLLAVNGRTLAGMKLAELQALLYQEEGDTVLTIEYDIAVQVRSVVIVMLVHLLCRVGSTGRGRCWWRWCAGRGSSWGWGSPGSPTPGPSS